MKNQNIPPQKTHHFRGQKTVSASEILSAGGTSSYAKSVGHNPRKVFNLPGEAISEEDLNKALEDLKRK